MTTTDSIQLRPVSRSEDDTGALPEMGKGCPATVAGYLPEMADKDGFDGAFGWVVVGASFLSFFMIGFAFTAFSILYLAFVEHFDSERGPVGWIGSLYFSSGNIFGFVNGFIVEKKGCRFLVMLGSVVWMMSFALSAFAGSIPQLYFSYGILGGLGYNMVTLSSCVIVQGYFKKYRSIAAGIAASGASVGSLVSGPVIGLLISIYGWRGTLLFMSGLAFNCCVFGCFYRPAKITTTPGDQVVQRYEKSPSIVAEENFEKRSLTKNSRYIVYCLSEFCYSFGISMFYHHTPSRAVELGMDRTSANFIHTVVGILTVFSRIIGASIGNCKCSDRMLQFGLSITACGICLFSAGFTRAYIDTFLVSGLTGFCSGLVLTIRTTVVYDIVGYLALPLAQGISMVFIGFAALLGVPLAGIIFDLTRDYNLPFYIGGGIVTVGGLAFSSLLIVSYLRPVAIPEHKQGESYS